MKTYEYTSLRLLEPSGGEISFLNSLGKQGWKVIKTESTHDSYGRIYHVWILLERELTEKAESIL